MKLIIALFALIVATQSAYALKTLVIAIIDESGSMGWGDRTTKVLTGYRSFLNKQKKIKSDDARYTMIKFSHISEVIDNNVPIAQATELTSKNYFPDGGTCLYKTIYEGIQMADAIKKDFDRIAFLILTDGDDNCGDTSIMGEPQIKKVADMISNRNADNMWTFIYIGEEHVEVAKNLNIPEDNSIDFNDENAEESFEKATIAITNIRLAVKKTVTNVFERPKTTTGLTSLLVTIMSEYEVATKETASESYNKFIADQQQSTSDTLNYVFIRYSSGVTVKQSNVSITEAVDIDHTTYTTQSCGAAYRAIRTGIESAKAIKSTASLDRIIVLIVSSEPGHCAPQSGLNETSTLISEVSYELNWTFVYVGTNSKSMAAKLGIPKNNAIDYDYTEISTTFELTSSAITKLRSKRDTMLENVFVTHVLEITTEDKCSVWVAIAVILMVVTGLSIGINIGLYRKR
jgi:hypothetical protein